MTLIKFQHKEIRARVIKNYIPADKPVIVFSCGNAAKALINAGLDVLHIGEYGELVPNQWFTQQDIQRYFPGHFDATSGHLSNELMLLVAKAFKKRLGELDKAEYDVPTGSGETLVCLKLAYPHIEFNAVYNMNKATEYSAGAPLNDLVQLLAKEVRGLEDVNDTDT